MKKCFRNRKGRAYGAEFQARVNATSGFNFNLSYTLVRSEFLNASNEYIPTGWDSKHLLNVTSTTELKKGLASWRKMAFCGRVALYAL
jgi:outer membrane receptor for ferrienterochelin and colicin